MLQKESFGKVLLHLPGDYARGMRNIAKGDPWIIGTLGTGAIGFGVGGVLGLVGSLGVMALTDVPRSTDTASVGWWIGVGGIETLITIGATVLGRYERRGALTNFQR